jgi:hypothetical protein
MLASVTLHLLHPNGGRYYYLETGGSLTMWPSTGELFTSVVLIGSIVTALGVGQLQIPPGITSTNTTEVSLRLYARYHFPS